jgi:hypothetical protein
VQLPLLSHAAVWFAPPAGQALHELPLQPWATSLGSHMPLQTFIGAPHVTPLDELELDDELDEELEVALELVAVLEATLDELVAWAMPPAAPVEEATPGAPPCPPVPPLDVADASGPPAPPELAAPPLNESPPVASPQPHIQATTTRPTRDRRFMRTSSQTRRRGGKLSVQDGSRGRG